MINQHIIDSGLSFTKLMKITRTLQKKSLTERAHKSETSSETRLWKLMSFVWRLSYFVCPLSEVPFFTCTLCWMRKMSGCGEEERNSFGWNTTPRYARRACKNGRWWLFSSVTRGHMTSAQVRILDAPDTSIS